MVKNEDFAVRLALVGIEMRCFGLKQGWHIAKFVSLTLRSITGGDQSLEAEILKVLGKILGKVTPLGVITRQQDRLATEHVWVIIQIGRDFLLNVMILSIELVILGLLSL